MSAPVGGAEVVAPLEDDRVDVVALDEVEDLDRLEALLLGRGEVVVLEVHELAVGDLVRLDDLVGGHFLALLLADLLVPDRRAVLLVHEMELEVVLVDRAVHPHGRVDETERDAPGPDRARHDRVVPGARPALNDLAPILPGAVQRDPPPQPGDQREEACCDDDRLACSEHEIGHEVEDARK